MKNKAGKYIEPTLEATTAAAESATINDDLTFFLGWADGDDAYPIAAQTWIIAYTTQADSAKAEAIRGFLTYLLTDGQRLAPDIDYAPLPADLAGQGTRQHRQDRRLTDPSYSWAGLGTPLGGVRPFSGWTPSEDTHEHIARQLSDLRPRRQIGDRLFRCVDACRRCARSS